MEVPLQKILKAILRVSKEDIYIELTERYGFTPEEISNMNPYTQHAYYRGKKVVNFNTIEEYNAYMASRGKK